MPTFAAAIAPRFVRERRSSAVPSVVEAGVIAILKQFEKLYTHMPLFTPYFSLDSSAYRVGNGGRLRCHMGAAGIGIYVMLLSHLRDCRDYRAPLDYDLLAFDLHEDADAVRRVVEEFDLFDIDRASGTFTSSALDAVRALGTSDSPSSGRTSTRTGRVRRVRTAAQAYRRSVRRLAADNALPPDAEEDIDEPADDPLAETKFAPADEEEETPSADAPCAAAEPAPAASENAPSPRTEEKRGEQNKIPHTPIVPFPPSGKGTRASHSSAPVVEEEEGASEAEVEGAVPTVADPPFTTAEIESAPADTRTPRGENDTTQATTSADAPDTRTPHGETDTTQATTSADAPDACTLRGETDTTPTTTSATDPDTRTPHGEGDATPTTLNTETANPAPLDPKTADDARSADAEDGETFVPPTANEVRRFAQSLHHPEFDAEWFVHYYTARHWQRHNGHPVRSWQTTARYWLTHPLQVAQHLLRHRPDPGATPAGTSVQLPGVSPSSAGTSPSPAGIISTTGSTSPSSVGIGAASAGTRPSSSTSGVPLGGSLSLPAPTPLQQSRLCDLRHMVHHLFADAPAAAPAAVSTVSDAPAAVATPAASAPTSVPTPRVLSPAEAAHFIEAQTLSADPAEEEKRACEISTADPEEGDGNCDELPTDAKEGIEAQEFPTDKAEEENRAHELSTTDEDEDELHCDELPSDGEEGIETQALSTDPAEEENRACEISTADNGEGDGNCDELDPDAEEGIEAQALPTARSEEEKRAHELSTADNGEDELNGDELNSDGGKNTDAQALSTDPTEEENRAHELSTADNGKGDGNCDEPTADAKEGIEAQALAADPAEKENRAHELSTADNGEGIDKQALPTANNEEEKRAHELSTADNEEDELNGDKRPIDAKESIEAQEFPTDKAEEENRAHELSTANIEEGIDTQAFSTTDNEKGDCNCDERPADIEKNMDTQAISTTKERFSTRSPHGPAPPTGDEAAATAARHRPPPHATEKHPFTLNLNHDAPPILPLHPPAPVGLGSTLRVQSAQPPFGRALLGRIDIGNAPCPTGSRPLRPQPAEDRRATPDHVSLGGGHEPKTTDFIDNSVADEHPHRSFAPEHHSDEPQRRDFAAKRHLDALLGSPHEPKTADLIDKSVADEHPSRSDAGKHPADEPEHRPTDGKHPADEHNAPAYEFDAGQRLLDTAVHRRAVRAELAACCGALRHLAHCCVAF